MKNTNKTKNVIQKTIVTLTVALMTILLFNGCLNPDLTPITESSNTTNSVSAPTEVVPPTPLPTLPPVSQPPPNPVPAPTPPPVKTTTYTSQIKTIAQQSSCAQFSWTSRGRAPVSYIKGMALSFARSLCRIQSTASVKPAAPIMMSVSSGNASKDVLAHYQDVLSSLGFRTATPGEEPLHATYTIGIGLGMRESSGKYCEGWDASAGSSRSSAEAEAGLFQASYNSMSASAELRKLYDEYKSDPSRCLLDVFKEGVTCKTQSILGSGAGAEFQDFVKKCPAFDTEYTMTLIRILRAHFGPLNRKEAQAIPACDNMLEDVRKIVDQDPESVCQELF